MLPARQAAKSDMSGSPWLTAEAKVTTTAESATPPASPSSPSMRLRALVTPATHSMVKGRLSAPSARGAPNGLAMLSTRKPIDQANAATANWTANLSQAEEPRRSS